LTVKFLCFIESIIALTLTLSKSLLWNGVFFAAICFIKTNLKILKHTLHNDRSNPVDAAIRELRWITLHCVNCFLTANAQIALIFRKFTHVILLEAKVQRFIEVAAASAEMNVLITLRRTIKKEMTFL
jgi:hypothetical protein